jgi:hypothetical protein
METDFYRVRETVDGLEVTDTTDDSIIELSGKSLSDYTYTNGSGQEYINEKKLSHDVKEELEVLSWLNQ